MCLKPLPVPHATVNTCPSDVVSLPVLRVMGEVLKREQEGSGTRLQDTVIRLRRRPARLGGGRSERGEQQRLHDLQQEQADETLAGHV
jgi:hypothetical protein